MVKKKNKQISKKKRMMAPLKFGTTIFFGGNKNTVHTCRMELMRMVLKPGIGNGEQESGNECTAVFRITIQNGERRKIKWSGN